MPSFEVTVSIKSLREALCNAQYAINCSVYNHDLKKSRSDILQQLIDECDRHRPLGSDGKHGNLHTPTCGCEDKGPQESWQKLTPVIHGQVGSALRTWCDRDISTQPNLELATEFKDITCPECRNLILGEI